MKLNNTLLLTALAAATSFSTEAAACGGLFCDGANPVNQAAERIVFAVNDDDTVTAAIEILYEGPSENFAWVLPVPEGEIKVDVSSTSALDAIDQQSNPIYRLNTEFDESCFGGGDDDNSASPALFAVADGESAEEGPSVNVIDSGNAGPYDWEQIMVNAAGEDPVQVALKWLTDNDYEVTQDTAERLEPYLEQDFNLVAFKLTKTNSEGSVRPVLITYPGTQPSIPIRPTAVAANEDMGIKVWVLGDSRAVSLNFRNLELNEAAIDWLNSAQNYNEVVIAAANEAGGHGFVTEHSGPAQAFAENIYPEWREDGWQELTAGQFDTVSEFLQIAFESFLGFDGVTDVFSNEALLPLRPGATREQFLNCISCYFDSNVAVRNNAYPDTPYVAGEDPLDEFDAQEFLEEFERLVVEPLRQTRALFEAHSTSTRFYTTLSPDEMTEDPLFDFNDELPDVDNQHQATRTLFCTDDGERWSIELPQGTIISGEDFQWPLSTQEMDNVPQNFRVLEMSARGEGEVINDNADAIQAALDDMDIGAISALGTSNADDDDGGDLSLTVGGCTVSRGSSHFGGWALLAGLGLLSLRRRRNAEPASDATR